MMEVVWEKDNLPHRETIAMWDEHVYCCQLNPGRVPTRDEMEACPEVFTCFCCLEKQPKKHLGGRYHGKWFCDFCIPYVDEWTAGVMVYWEEKRKKRNSGKHPQRITYTKAERESQIESAIVWCLMHGYPTISK